MKILPLFDGYYIKSNNVSWVLGKEGDTTNIAYGQEFYQIVESAVSRDLRVPDDVHQLVDKINELYTLIETKFPSKMRIANVFVEAPDNLSKKDDDDDIIAESDLRDDLDAEGADPLEGI
jgi:hypothetical protein